MYIAVKEKHIANPFVSGSNELGFPRLFENDLLEIIPLRLNSFLYCWFFTTKHRYNRFGITAGWCDGYNYFV